MGKKNFLHTITLDGISKGGVLQNTPFDLTVCISIGKCDKEDPGVKRIAITIPQFTFTLTEEGYVTTVANPLPVSMGTKDVNPMYFLLREHYPAPVPAAPTLTYNLVVYNDGKVGIRPTLSASIGNNKVDFLPAGTYTVYQTRITNNYLFRQLDTKITLEGLLQFDTILSDIAKEDPVNGRVSGGPAFFKAANFIKDTMTNLGYNVIIQSFTYPTILYASIPTLTLISPFTKDYIPSQDFAYGINNTPTPIGGIEAEVVLPTGTGCLLSDYANVAGKIVLLRPTLGPTDCTLPARTLLAQSQGAVAVLYQANLAASGAFALPGLNVSIDTFNELSNLINTNQHPVIKMVSISETRDREQWNVIAESPYGDPTKQIIFGSHLDTVLNQGSNDNTSGCSTWLELASHFKQRCSKNQVIFAFWGAEEYGIIGSSFYVQSRIDDGTFQDIALYSNIDMSASNNYYRNMATLIPPLPNLPNFQFQNAESVTRTVALANLAFDYLSNRNLPVNLGFTSGTDIIPFFTSENPRPFVDAFHSGISTPKTPVQEQIYGGRAGVGYDTCYHLLCDTLEHVTTPTLNSQGISNGSGTVTFLQAAQDNAYLLETFSKSLTILKCYPLITEFRPAPTGSALVKEIPVAEAKEWQEDWVKKAMI